MSAKLKTWIWQLAASARGKTLLLWLLQKLPNRFAVMLATELEKLPVHIENTSDCLPCRASAVIKRAAHDATIGPGRVCYCSKCGLPQNKWPRFCANVVKQVNNPPERKSRRIIKPVFWS